MYDNQIFIRLLTSGQFLFSGILINVKNDILQVVEQSDSWSKSPNKNIRIAVNTVFLK